MQNFRYTIAFLLSVAVLCPQAYAMKRILNARTLPELMAKRCVSSGAMDVNQAFRVLGLSSATSLKQMREKYHELLKVHHPDRNRNSKASTDKTKEINQAYKLVKEYLENRPQPNPTGAQQNYQQQGSRSSYSSQNTHNAGYNTHNQQQYWQARSRSNYSSNDRQQYQEDWSSSSSSIRPYFWIGGVGFLIACNVIKNEYKRRYKELRRRKDIAYRAYEKKQEKKREKNRKKTFHYAIRDGDKEKVKKFIKAGISLYVKEPDPAYGIQGETPLNVAVKSGDKEIFEILIDAGVQVNYTSGDHGDSALLVAVGSKNKEMVKLLLDRKADPNLRNSRRGSSRTWTPLGKASAEGYTAIMKILLDAGAEVDHVTMKSCTPLKLAVRQGHKGAVEMLLDAGAKVNASERYTALDVAADRGHNDIVKILRAAGGKFANELNSVKP